MQEISCKNLQGQIKMLYLCNVKRKDLTTNYLKTLQT